MKFKEHCKPKKGVLNEKTSKRSAFSYVLRFTLETGARHIECHPNPFDTNLLYKFHQQTRVYIDRKEFITEEA